MRRSSSLLVAVALLAGCAPVPAGPRMALVPLGDLRHNCEAVNVAQAVEAVVLKPVCARREDAEIQTFCKSKRASSATLQEALKACGEILDASDTAPPSQTQFDASKFFELLGKAIKLGLGAL